MNARRLAPLLIGLVLSLAAGAWAGPAVANLISDDCACKAKCCGDNCKCITAQDQTPESVSALPVTVAAILTDLPILTFVAPEVAPTPMAQSVLQLPPHPPRAPPGRSPPALVL